MPEAPPPRPPGLARRWPCSSAAAPSAAPRRDTTQPYRSLDVLAEVLAYVQNSYVEEMKEKELVHAAIEGMVQRLDPHSMLLRPDVYRAMRDETTGEFDGVGLEVSQEADEIVVVAPLADSPAERAGHPGRRPDRRRRRRPHEGDAPRRGDAAHEGSRGQPGGALDRAGRAARSRRSFTLVRDHVRTHQRRLAGPRPGVRAPSTSGSAAFQDRTDRELRQALDGARKELGGPIQGLVLDLRNNPGGLLEQAVKVADRFLSSGVIVTTEGRGKQPEVEEAHEKDTEPAYPVVLLVNRGSASASEIVAGRAAGPRARGRGRGRRPSARARCRPSWSWRTGRP